MKRGLWAKNVSTRRRSAVQVTLRREFYHLVKGGVRRYVQACIRRDERHVR